MFKRLSYLLIALSLPGVVLAVKDKSTEGIYDMGGRKLIDKSVEVTGAIQADKWIEMINTSTPTTPSIATHARFFYNNGQQKLCAVFGDGTQACLGPGSSGGSGVLAGATQPILYNSTTNIISATLISISTGLITTGTSGVLTLASSATFQSNVLLSSAVATQFTATYGTFTLVNVTSGTIQSFSFSYSSGAVMLISSGSFSTFSSGLVQATTGTINSFTASYSSFTLNNTSSGTTTNFTATYSSFTLLHASSGTIDNFNFNTSTGNFAVISTVSVSEIDGSKITAPILTYNADSIYMNLTQGSRAAANQIGANNVAVGKNSMQSFAGTGIDNTCVGSEAGSSMQGSASYNTAIGFEAMGGGVCNNINACFQNVAIGEQSMDLASGSNQVGVGVNTLQNNIGVANTVLGAQAAIDMTSGSSNTFVGSQSGQDNGNSSSTIAGSGNTFLGYFTGQNVIKTTAINNSIALGFKAVVTSSNTAQIGGVVGSGNEVNVHISTLTIDSYSSFPYGLRVSTLTVFNNIIKPTTFIDSMTVISSSGSYINYELTGGSLTARNINSGTQCVHADSSGHLTGTGSDCASGGGASLSSTQTWTASQTFNGNASVTASSFTASSATFKTSAVIVNSSTNACGYLIGSLVQVFTSTSNTNMTTASACNSYVNTTLGNQPFSLKCASDILVTQANFSFTNNTNASGCRFRFAGSNIGFPAATNIMEEANAGGVNSAIMTMTLNTTWTPGATTSNAPVLQVCADGGTCSFLNNSAFQATMYEYEYAQ